MTPVTATLTSTGAPIVIPKHRHYQKYTVVNYKHANYTDIGELVKHWFQSVIIRLPNVLFLLQI